MVRKIKNKHLRRELDARGLKDVKLYKDTDYCYHYFTCEKYVKDTLFCMFFFNECTPAEWAAMIQERINNH